MAFGLADIVAIVFLIGFLVNGFRRGFILTAGHLIGILAGVLTARYWSPALAVRLSTLSTWGIPRGWFYVAAAIIVFFIVARIILAIAGLVNSVFKIFTIIPFLESANKIAGALLGVVVGVAFIGGLGNYNGSITGCVGACTARTYHAVVLFIYPAFTGNIWNSNNLIRNIF